MTWLTIGVAPHLYRRRKYPRTKRSTIKKASDTDRTELQRPVGCDKLVDMTRTVGYVSTTNRRFHGYLLLEQETPARR